MPACRRRPVGWPVSPHSSPSAVPRFNSHLISLSFLWFMSCPESASFLFGDSAAILADRTSNRCAAVCRHTHTLTTVMLERAATPSPTHARCCVGDPHASAAGSHARVATSADSYAQSHHASRQPRLDAVGGKSTEDGERY